jgi:endo-1,4-beta-xylanase
MLTRRNFLMKLGSMIGLGALNFPVCPKYTFAKEYAQGKIYTDLSIKAQDALRSRATKKGLIFGSVGLKDNLSNDEVFAGHFWEECNILVPGIELKWAALRPTPFVFNFDQADWLEQFSRNHNLLFRGHTLVWHEALPDWFQSFVNRQNAERILREHILTVAGRYRGKMHSWDVVNEAIQPYEGQPGGLRNSPWLQLLGPQYLDIAFHTAAEADPHALLVLNQDQLEYDKHEDENCRISILKLLERLKSNGTPIHALGIQAHLLGDENRFNPNKFRAFLRDVASLGLKIMITEMDVADQHLPYDKNIRDDIVAIRYKEFLSVALDEPAVIAVITWGLSDKYTWLADVRPRDDKAPVRPLLLDTQFQRKLAWYTVTLAIDDCPKR